MRTITYVAIVWILFAGTLNASLQAQTIDPIEIGFAGPMPAGFEIKFDPRAPVGKTWDEFLEKLHHAFDRNRDGSLDRAEVGRMFSLPLADRKTLAWDFAALDSNKDGAVSPGELKAYASARGFTRVMVVIQAPTADDSRLAPLFARDLAQFDLNDDERIERREMLVASESALVRPGRLIRHPGDAEDLLVVTLGARGEANRYVVNNQRLEIPRFRRGNWVLGFDPVRGGFDGKPVREFLLAQFHTARADRPALTPADIEDDAALLGLQSLFAYADRDGDGRLTAAELEAHLSLIELGARCQVWITVANHEQNLFPVLDLDGDGAIDVHERRLARPLLLGKQPWDCARIAFAPPAAMVWGGVLLPLSVASPRKPAHADAPEWFRAMDRNGDGWISPREFLGPPVRFQELDSDGDGLISVAEARNAGP